MNGIEKIINKIASDAQIEADSILETASKEISEIQRQNKISVNAEYDRLTSRYKREAQQHLERLKSAIELDARKQLLAVKQEQISLVFERAVEKLHNLSEKEYVDLLVSLAVRASTTGKETILLNANDYTRFGKLTVESANQQLKNLGRTGELKLAENTRSIDGGIILVDGPIELNCSISALVEQQRNDMASQIAQLLFS